MEMEVPRAMREEVTHRTRRGTRGDKEHRAAILGLLVATLPLQSVKSVRAHCRKTELARVSWAAQNKK